MGVNELKLESLFYGCLEELKIQQAGFLEVKINEETFILLKQ